MKRVLPCPADLLRPGSQAGIGARRRSNPYEREIVFKIVPANLCVVMPLRWLAVGRPPCFLGPRAVATSLGVETH
jgi:hypothetical protein